MGGRGFLEGTGELISMGWNDFHRKYGDARVENWLFMSSPLPTVLIVIGYLYFCLSLGPKLMEKRKPYQLKAVLLFYNVFNIIINLYAFNEGLQGGWFGEYKLYCQPVDYSQRPSALRMLNASYVYFIIKNIDLLDTIFFVLRKKNNQVTFLHVYHHSLMPILTWISAAYYPGGHCSLQAMLNTFVHVVMYSYYFCAALVPSKYLWWKRYITWLQLMQFVYIIYHQCHVFSKGCDIPVAFTYFCLAQSTLFLVLFSRFYIMSYVKKEKTT